MMSSTIFKAVCLSVILAPLFATAAEPSPPFDRKIAPLLKSHCVKCHGPAKREGGLDLSTPTNLARGGKNGPVVTPHDLQASPLWERVDKDEMPPDRPLTADEKASLKRWIVAGVPGLPTINRSQSDERDHWSFQRLAAIVPPTIQQPDDVTDPIDSFINAARIARGLSGNSAANRATLIRRISFDLTGLPPTLAELDEFLNDPAADAVSRLIDRYLASPHYGERWGKYWLDAAGYADSNGYFNADTDRPLAYRYRDYVIRALNTDKPFDQFVREQLAGDEMARFDPERKPSQPVNPEIIELLEATHYLRNAQDGSGESDGNADEVRIDRYSALEGAMQITASSLLGLTIQCAKCHSHKFEPISHQDYYQMQAVFYPAFNIENWIKPNERFVLAPLPAEQERWETRRREVEESVGRSAAGLAEWVKMHRLTGQLLFADAFDDSASIHGKWSATAPGDDAPGGDSPVTLDGDSAPAAKVDSGRLQIIDGGSGGSRWISTIQAFDWTPANVGESIQATFDLVDNKLAPDGKRAERIGYYIALHDYNDNSPIAGGNLLIDGNPAGPTVVHLDYPGADSRPVGNLGTSNYLPGHNYGIRITNLGKDQFQLEQLVDSVPDDKPLKVTAAELPDGGFGFEFCCGRSFLVDNIRVEKFDLATTNNDQLVQFRDELKSRKKVHDTLVSEQQNLISHPPGKIAWTTDMRTTPVEVHLLERGNHSTPGPAVQPAPLGVLIDPDAPFVIPAAVPGEKTSRRRMAWANWVTHPGSRASSLLARVQVNRIWQQHFGVGIVSTPENLGLSGSAPSHPEMLDWLAAELVRSGWSTKAIHRRILNSSAFQQSSHSSQTNHEVDPENRLLWRFSLRRLDAEAIRDAMLAVSGDLSNRIGGIYVPTTRTQEGEVLVNESDPNAGRRSIYLYQRRTQVVSFLSVFDTPTIVFNSVRRLPSTIPLQSLSQLNSDFAVARSRGLAERLMKLDTDDSGRIQLAYRLLFSRVPTSSELSDAQRFLEDQTHAYADDANPRSRAWFDLSQTLIISNEFLYVE